jgi:hypothetical protein
MAEAEDDQSLFERIWYADQDERLLIGIDLRHFNRPGSPTHSHFDNTLPLIATVCCVATAWMLGGWVWGLGILASCVILTLTTANVWVMHRLRKRTLAVALSGLEGWREIWRYGGVTLRLMADYAGASSPGPEAHAPADDWQTFARNHLPLERA